MNFPDINIREYPQIAIEINKTIEGWMTDDELVYLRELAQNVPANGTIVEIGTYAGKSTLSLATFCPDGVHVYCFDMWLSVVYKPKHPVFYQFIEMIDKLQLNNVIVLNDMSPPSKWTTPVDLVFIDAIHEYKDVVEDIKFWEKHLNSEGVMCGHDYASDHEEVMRAVKDEARRMNKMIEVHETIWRFK
jgi:predicted O-methyltransferase YrrM